MDNECRVDAGALRGDLRCLADHRHRPAARGGIGAGGHQHRAQPGFQRYQPGAGGRRPAGGAIPARGGDRNAAARRPRWSPSSPWRRNCRRCTGPGRTCWGPTCATCGWRSSTRRSRSIWRRANDAIRRCRALTAALVVFVGAFIAEPVLLGLARIFGLYAIVQERTCRVYMLFGKVLGVLDEPGLHFLPAKLGPAAFVDQPAGHLPRARSAARPGVPAQPAGEFRGRRAHGDRHLVRDVDQRSGGVPVQEHRPARLAARQRQQRHGALPEQHAAGGNAGDAPQHEPDGARRGHRQVPGVGLPTRLGLHPQGAFPRCGHDPADRREGGEPAAPGDLGHQAGRRQPGERDHQFGRARSRRSSSPRRRPSGPRRWGRRSRRSPANRRSPRRCSRFWRRSA